MRAVFILLLAFFFIAANTFPLPKARLTLKPVLGRASARSTQVTAAQCSLSCTTAGSTCGSNSSIIEVLCPENYQCNVNSVCSVLPSIGSACSSSGCSGDDSTCSAGTCVAVTYTATVGQACTSINQCATANIDCKGGICVALPAVGASCTATNECGDSSYCSNSVCTAYFSIATGGACQFTDQCIAGDFCSGSDVCTAGFASSNVPCAADTDCTIANEECDCPINGNGAASCQSPTVYTSGQATALANALNCAFSNKCSVDIDSDSSCTSCKSQYCAYYHQVLAGPGSDYAYPALVPCLGDSNTVALAKSWCGAASTVAASLALLIFAALFASL